jgi:hypothetical protein
MPLPHTLHVPVMLCSAVLHLLNICMCCMCHQQIMPGCGCKLPLSALCMLLLPLTHSDKQSVELFAEEGVTFLLHPLQ